MAQTWLERLFGKTSAAVPHPPSPVENRLRELGLRDPTCVRAVALQMAYWQPTLPSTPWQVGVAGQALSWPQRLQQHHLLCRAYAALECPEFWTTDVASTGSNLANVREALQQSQRDLLQPESPYRGQHGYIWQGLAPPLEDEPAPDHIGTLRARSITHLGCLEIVRLNAAHEPDRLDFVSFAEIDTLALLPETIFAAGLLLRGDAKEPVLVPTRHGLTWWAKDATLGLMPRAIPLATASGEAPTLAARDALWIGLQEVICDADDLARGSTTLGLHECYQFSWQESGCGSASTTPAPARTSLNKLRL